MHLVERVASGIPHMQEAMKEAKLSEPEFHTDGIFTVAFKRQVKNYATDGIENDTVNMNEQTIIDLLKTKSGLNASEIAESIPKANRFSLKTWWIRLKFLFLQHEN